MPDDPEPMAETSGGNRRMVVVPARVPRVKFGANDLQRDVLLRVLSCMDARQAVQTCVLSKLWRDLWRNMPRINALCSAFGIGDRYYYDPRMWLFKRFVNRLLMLRNPVPLDEFHLWYIINEDDESHEANPEDANRWIHHALLCNARSVEFFSLADRLDLNHAVFTSQHLTSLLFYSVILESGFFRQLQTGCKALERLILPNCCIDDIEISSQTLKFLSIGIDCFFGSWTSEQASLSLPNLIHLGFVCEFKLLPLLKNMESLETAYINLLNSNGLPVHDIRQFLLGLSGVTKLEFYFGKTELMMGMNLNWCPKFNNLKFLSLNRWYHDANFYGLKVFLQNSPNLEHLTLDLKQKQLAEVPEAVMGDARNISFTCEHLQTVEIICSEDDPVVNSLREFLIGSGISDGQIHIEH